MPTGYTARLYEGDQSPPDFITGIAKSMGFLIDLRDAAMDAPIPNKFELDEYKTESIRESYKEWVKWSTASMEWVAKHQEKLYADTRKSNAEAIEKKQAILARYTAMKTEMEKWQPTDKSMKSLKELAISQLEDSIKYDCNMDYFEDPKPTPVEQYYAEMMESKTRSLMYDAKSLYEAVCNLNMKNAAIAEFFKEVQTLRKADETPV